MLGNRTAVLCAVVALASVPASMAADLAVKSYTTRSNLMLRASWGDLGDIQPADDQPPSGHAVRIGEGASELLQECLTDPIRWKKDRWYARLAHAHAMSSIGCRERSSPGLHVVFYKNPEGGRDAWAHFDLHGPQNIPAHLTEVVRNRLSLGRTSEYEVHRGLMRLNPVASGPVPVPRYDFSDHAQSYLRATFSAKAVLSASASAAANITTRRNPTMSDFRERLASNLARNTTRNSIEFATAAFLQQEGTYVRSTEEGVLRRATHAVYRTFIVPGREGDEFAFPRVAAALGTAYMTRQFHPGYASTPNPWVDAAGILGRYVARSLWSEFKPEIMFRVRRAFHRDRDPDQLAQR